MSDLAALFANLERQHGLPSGYLARTAQIESSMDPNAQNSESSAGGLFQFIDSTARDYNLRNRFDPIEASNAAARLAADNRRFLSRRLGREPTAAELYLAHQQGAGGAYNLLSNPNRAVGGAEVTLNAGRAGMRGGDFANQWLAKFDGAPAPQGAIALASRQQGGAPSPGGVADVFEGPDMPQQGQQRRRPMMPQMPQREPVYVAPVGHEQMMPVNIEMPMLPPIRRA